MTGNIIHRFLRNIAGMVIIASVFVVLMTFARSTEELVRQLASPNNSLTTVPLGKSDLSQ